MSKKYFMKLYTSKWKWKSIVLLAKNGIKKAILTFYFIISDCLNKFEKGKTCISRKMLSVKK